ncbi:unnamed protein product [Cercospora beticola]|nr:unnamed protein product [Cercospora beticola]
MSYETPRVSLQLQIIPYLKSVHLFAGEFVESRQRRSRTLPMVCLPLTRHEDGATEPCSCESTQPSPLRHTLQVRHESRADKHVNGQAEVVGRSGKQPAVHALATLNAGNVWGCFWNDDKVDAKLS